MRDYFCGWYLKCQSDTQTLAVIPAIHISKKMKSSSIQLITDEGAWNIELSYHDFHKQKQPFHIQAAGNYFTFGPAVTSFLPSSLPVNFTKFFTKRLARSSALTSQSLALL